MEECGEVTTKLLLERVRRLLNPDNPSVEDADRGLVAASGCPHEVEFPKILGTTASRGSTGEVNEVAAAVCDSNNRFAETPPWGAICEVSVLPTGCPDVTFANLVGTTESLGLAGAPAKEGEVLVWPSGGVWRVRERLGEEEEEEEGEVESGEKAKEGGMEEEGKRGESEEEERKEEKEKRRREDGVGEKGEKGDQGGLVLKLARELILEKWERAEEWRKMEEERSGWELRIKRKMDGLRSWEKEVKEREMRLKERENKVMMWEEKGSRENLRREREGERKRAGRAVREEEVRRVQRAEEAKKREGKKLIEDGRRIAEQERWKEWNRREEERKRVEEGRRRILQGKRVEGEEIRERRKKIEEEGRWWYATKKRGWVKVPGWVGQNRPLPLLPVDRGEQRGGGVEKSRSGNGRGEV